MSFEKNIHLALIQIDHVLVLIPHNSYLMSHVCLKHGEVISFVLVHRPKGFLLVIYLSCSGPPKNPNTSSLVMTSEM